MPETSNNSGPCLRRGPVVNPTVEFSQEDFNRLVRRPGEPDEQRWERIGAAAEREASVYEALTPVTITIEAGDLPLLCGILESTLGGGPQTDEGVSRMDEVGRLLEAAQKAEAAR